MRKLLMGLGIAAAAAFTAVPSAQALTYLGTFAGNDPFPGALGSPYNSPALAKCDDISPTSLACNWEDGPTPGDYTDAFNIVFIDSKHATWSWTPSGDETLLPAYVVVKGGPNYALYSLDGALSGSLNTDDLFVGAGNHPDFSHISFYDSAVPEPAIWALMIAAFGLLGWQVRRRAYAA